MTDAWVGFAGAIIGVLVGAGITIYQDIRKEKRVRREDAQYLAIRVSCMLDRFVKGCLDVAYDDGTSEGLPAGKDGAYEPQIREPEFPINTIDGNWKSIRSDLMYQLLGFPSRIEHADHLVGVVAFNEDDPGNAGWVAERQFQYATLGLEAVDLAIALRRDYSIPTQAGGDEPAASLRKCLDGLLERRRKIEAMRAAATSLID